MHGMVEGLQRQVDYMDGMKSGVIIGIAMGLLAGFLVGVITGVKYDRGKDKGHTWRRATTECHGLCYKTEA